MKMEKDAREIYYELCNGNIKTLMNCIKTMENSPHNKKYLGALLHVYCERIKEKAYVEVLDISFTDNYNIYIIVKIKTDDQIIITDITDNKNVPYAYIENQHRFVTRRYSIAYALYYNNPQYCKYYTVIADAIDNFCDKHFRNTYDVIQLISNKRYENIIKKYGGI